jgi:uncharacterized lipoprotein YmbA
MTSPRFRTVLGWLAPAAIGLSACGHSAPTRYLTLAVVPPAASLSPDDRRLVLRTPQVRWPAALDRLEVLRPAGDVRLVADETSRWSAAPGELAAAALTQDLQARLPGLTLAAADPGPEAVEMAVEVLAMTRTEEGYRLNAFATLSGGGRAPRSLFLSVSTPALGQDAEAQAHAVSRLIGSLADSLAPALAGLSPAASGRSASPRPAP